MSDAVETGRMGPAGPMEDDVPHILKEKETGKCWIVSAWTEDLAGKVVVRRGRSGKKIPRAYLRVDWERVC